MAKDIQKQIQDAYAKGVFDGIQEGMKIAEKESPLRHGTKWGAFEKDYLEKDFKKYCIELASDLNRTPESVLFQTMHYLGYEKPTKKLLSLKFSS